MSVTSSGRSSSSTTIRWASGWLPATAAAICWSSTVLPVLGGATIRPRWPLPTGATRSMTRGGHAARRVFEPQPLSRVQRGEVTEVRAAAQLFGRAAVDPLDLGEGARPAAYAFDEVALAQAVSADQRGGDLDVGAAWAGRLGGAQVPLPVARDVEDTGGACCRELLL